MDPSGSSNQNAKRLSELPSFLFLMTFFTMLIMLVLVMMTKVTIMIIMLMVVVMTNVMMIMILMVMGMFPDEMRLESASLYYLHLQGGVWRGAQTRL